MPVRLFVGNLPYNATEAELREHFSPVGQLSYIYLPTDRETGKPRGFAFVEFNDRAQAEEAIRRFNSQPFKGRPLAVNEARAKDDRPQPGGPSRPPGGPPRTFTPRPSWSPDPAIDEPPARKEGRARNFGPDAAPRRKGKQASRAGKSERGPKGPIRERPGGQFFGTDEEDFEDNLSAEEEAFTEDNFASRVDDEEEGDG